MSLHAQISPEAQARLQLQRRTTTIGSLIIGFLMIGLVGVILLVINLGLPPREFSRVIFQPVRVDESELVEVKKMTTITKRKPVRPVVSRAKVMVATTVSPTAVPIPNVTLSEPSFDLGGEGLSGADWGGSEVGSGRNFSNIPLEMKRRCSKDDRLERLNSNGGNAKCEESVVSALRWLQQEQNEDGSWSDKRRVGMTALAILSYLGHCETASSEEFGETVLRGVTYLVDRGLKQNGRLADDLKDGHWSYEHGIAVYALAEAYTLCVKSFEENIPGVEAVVKSSGQFLIDHQHKSGGWDYGYSVDSSRGGDSSIAAWHLQALKAMEYTGIPFKGLSRARRDGLEYIKNLQVASGAVAYSPNKIHDDGTTLAAAGALCFQMWGKPSHQLTRKACRLIDQKMKFDWDGADSDLYGHYYAAQAMINYGGDYWKRYNKLFRDEVLSHQAKNGMFLDVVKNVGGKINGKGVRFIGTSKMAQIYRTCLATLSLEVYYRFLPTAAS